ncbi:hypothetical protein P152DRAFT_456904 [Eremomyces bilateralis CBS 781.70]|uniref:Uncharacterized protein n=1 Tax=Eremomyces bilateralis CBS 781.70 TaxID=1392243 RepID=A0A6G1G9G8_9PEZI|nr:uncharacterized protein P152DRAFT_456904 [Eremomyces bilateralis CBS 781.70]KAF1814632.1 hypothetical protein P152DRAFT_456904 [Eremomyces bilateralis CBS 781.70]
MSDRPPAVLPSRRPEWNDACLTLPGTAIHTPVQPILVHRIFASSGFSRTTIIGV